MITWSEQRRWPCRCKPSESVGCTETSITYIRNTAALLHSPCLLPSGWRPHLLLLADFNLVSGHVRAPRLYTTIRRLPCRASPIWFGLTGFSSDRGLIKGCVPSGRGANRKRSCSARGVGARAATAITADDLVIVFYSIVLGSLFPSTLPRNRVRRLAYVAYRLRVCAHGAYSV